MANNQYVNIDEFLKEYKTLYDDNKKTNPDFNILSSIHLGENDHTNILRDVLNMSINGELIFMKSFVKDILGINLQDEEYNKFIASTQESAIGKKGKGFIDLVIKTEKSNKTVIVIENKVCKAADQIYQLERYYYSYIKPCPLNTLPGEYKEACEGWWKVDTHKEAGVVYLVYLSYDAIDDDSVFYNKDEQGGIFPTITESLFNCLDKHEHFIKISYSENLFDWFKNVVLEKIPHGKSGSAGNSIELYVDELEKILSISDRNSFYKDNKKQLHEKMTFTDVELNDKKKLFNKYIEIEKAVHASKSSEIEAWEKDCLSCIQYYKDNVFNDICPEGWKIHSSSGYITFSPISWFEKYGGRKTCNVHFTITNWRKDGRFLSFELQGSATKLFLFKKGHYEDSLAESVINMFNNESKDFKIEKPEEETGLNRKFKFKDFKFEDKFFCQFANSMLDVVRNIDLILCENKELTNK